MTDRIKDSSTYKTRSGEAALDAQYHKIGISALAAVLCYQNVPDAKEPAHDPGPGHDHDSPHKAA